MRRDVRILLVGDGALPGFFMPSLLLMCIAEGVGKSTIVTSLIKESYVAHVSTPSLSSCSGLSRTAAGATYCPRGDYPTRSHSRKRDNIHRRFRRRVARDRPTSALLTWRSHWTAGPHDRIHLESEIRKAHVICIVYSIDNPNSFDRIPTYWLPHFRQLGVNVGVFA